MVDSTLIQLLLLFLLFYLFLIRPEIKKAKKHQGMLDALKKGDKVITRGGIVAKIVKIENEYEVTAEIAEGVNVLLNKAGILSLFDENTNTASASKAPTKNKKEKK